VAVLNKSLTECGFTKSSICNKTQNIKADSLRSIIFKQKDIENNLILINTEQLMEKGNKEELC
jgi:hypothetical protein